MEKEKQIEEMAEIAYNAICIQIGGGDFVEVGDRQAAAEIVSEDLYNAGYGNVKEALKEFAERVKERIEMDKYIPEITKDYDEEDKNNCMYYNLGLNHAQIIIDFFIKEVYGD